MFLGCRRIPDRSQDRMQDPGNVWVTHASCMVIIGNVFGHSIQFFEQII